MEDIAYYTIILYYHYIILYSEMITGSFISFISSNDVMQLSLTLKMTTAQVVETSVTDTPRYSLCSVRKNVKVYQYLYAIDDLFSSRVFPPVE